MPKDLIRKKSFLFASYKKHLLIATLLSMWLVIFLIIIGPFDISQLSLKNRIILMPFYGIITFVSYMILVPFENWVFFRFKKWRTEFELVFILVFSVIALFACYAYYKSNILNGDYNFAKFSLEIFYPTFILLLSILVISRWFLFLKRLPKKEDTIVLQGSNKLDTLQLPYNSIICLNAAGNYVEVSYLLDGKLNKKLVRNTLTKIAHRHPEFIRAHRSYLINPMHFVAWKNQKTIQLRQMEIPVSKQFHDKLRKRFSNRP